MVLCHIHLISLRPGTTLASLLAALRRAGAPPLAQARPLRWMVLPTATSAGRLAARNRRWDALVILPAGHAALPASVARTHVADGWSVAVGASARALAAYAAVNRALLHPDRPPTPAVSSVSVSADARNLEATPELASWIAGLPADDDGHDPDAPVSMLNLLAFRPGRKAQYVRYGEEFGRRVGARHGGRVKLVGRVTGFTGDTEEEEGVGGWDEIAFVHYPSVRHFAAMAADPDYQDVNRRYRLGALRDTFILCVVEVDDDGRPAAGKGGAPPRERL
ncbi:hypothetical protein F4780DRAFT_775424 [Xylariomycetidae sp. FL0641]|nr:hypothetical protein F4780DRAFT_775424 [Xylariomycetidae sp. FL0641]